MNKNILITGGAQRVGKEISLFFAEKGACRTQGTGIPVGDADFVKRRMTLKNGAYFSKHTLQSGGIYIKSRMLLEF
jgi:hypothetical protein